MPEAILISRATFGYGTILVAQALLPVWFWWSHGLLEATAIAKPAQAGAPVLLIYSSIWISASLLVLQTISPAPCDAAGFLLESPARSLRLLPV